MIEKKIIREKDGEFCRLEVKVHMRAEGAELSICGTHGEVLTEKQARKSALEYWESFFDDSPEELKSMNERFGKRFRSSRRAAQFVLDCDGEYHGLDVAAEEDGKVYVAYSCGQIREDIARFFPEAVPYFPWHLNLWDDKGALPPEVIAWVESL